MRSLHSGLRRSAATAALKISLGCLALAVLSALPARADNGAVHWPQFRGPDARGVAPVENESLPLKWSTDHNVAWRTPIPGTGWSSPIVWGDRIFITTVVSEGEVEAPKKGLYFGGSREAPEFPHSWEVYCLDLKTGSVVWERTAHSGLPPTGRHLKNTYASETPATDGEMIYAYFGNQGLYAYTMDGEPVWEKSWPVYPTRYGWGTAASPVLHGDRLYVVNDNDEHSFLTALDKKTGEEIWTVEREEGTNWVTPFIWENDRRTEIVTVGTNAARSYDLDGNELWRIENMSSIAIPTPFTAHGLLYISSGYIMDKNKPVFAVRPGASGDITPADGESTNEFIAWHLPEAGSYNPSALVYGDYYYTLWDRGFFTCHNAKTGELVYDKQRITPQGGAFTTSPWAYRGHIFCLSEDGDTYVIKAGPEFEVVGKNTIPEMSMASPAIAGDSLILRTADAVYRIRKTN